MTVIYGFANRSTLIAQTLTEMRAQLDELSRQLATGKRSETYGGLGLGRGLDLQARERLSRIDSYEAAVFHVDLRVGIMNTALERLRAIASETRAEANAPAFELVSGGQTASQRSAAQRLDEALSLLNEKVGEHYLFSGRATDRRPVEASSHILNGDGTRAGLRQLIAERLLADQGADGRGRLLAPAVAGSEVTLAEDGVHPFGFKLSSATTDFGATVTGPGGVPPSLSIDLGANPPEGGRVTLRLALPDGSGVTLELTATSELPPPDRAFAIGATPADTAANLAAVMDAELQRLANTELAAASAVQASTEFFAIDGANPPQRVDGPPFESATALRDATATDTVRWYAGDDALTDARTSVIARVDDTITVAYGVRANEDALRWVVQNVAVYAAVTFSPTDPDTKARHAALARRVGAGLDVPDGMQRIEAIQTEIAGAKLAAGAAKQRLTEKKPVLQGVLDEIENVSQEEVAAMLLALNTRMQATFQTTALLSRFSLLDFI